MSKTIEFESDRGEDGLKANGTLLDVINTGGQLINPSTSPPKSPEIRMHGGMPMLGLHFKHESEQIEYTEQFYAQVAALACEVPHVSIAEGLRRSVLRFKKGLKTKQEWNSERVRANPQMKKKIKQKLDEAHENLDLHGAGGYSSFSEDLDPIPYLANYTYGSFQESLRNTNRKLANFGAIRVVDLAGQLIGDSRASDLLFQLRRCPLQVLNLSENQLTDKSMKQLSIVLRSFTNCESLILSRNNITDAGIEMIMHDKTFSPTLRKLDITCNSLGTRAAFFIGKMFRPGVKASLDALHMGGRVGRRGWGDEFLRILVDLLCQKGARPIRVFSYPQGSLTHEGIKSVAALVVCSQKLEVLNLSKNTLEEFNTRRFLRDALRSSMSLREVYFGACGLHRHERDELETAAYSRSQLTWAEKIDLAFLTSRELNYCRKLGYALDVVITNNWQSDKPPDWPTLEPHIPSKEEMVANYDSSAAKDDKTDKIVLDIPVGQSASMPIPVPLDFLTSNMKLPRTMCQALRACDEVQSYMLRMKRCFYDCMDWLKENVEFFRIQGEQKVLYRAFIQRERTLLRKRESLLIMLEKFTSISLSRIQYGVDGKIRKVKDRSAGKKKKKDFKKGGKASKLTPEIVAMSIEELNGCYIETADSLQLLLGASYAVKVRFVDIQKRILTGKQNFDTSRRGAVSKQASKSKDTGELLPAAGSLGYAALYIHYIYIASPEEVELAKKAAQAKKRDEKRQNDKRERERKRQLLKDTRTTGQLFRVLRSWEIEERNQRLGYDPQQRADEEERIAKEEAARREEESARENERLRLIAEAEAADSGIEEEETDDEEEEESSSEEEQSVIAKVVRERTRFLVPKREMVERYESVYVDDLLADKVAMKNAVNAFSRSNRNHIVREVAVHLEPPADTPGRTVPVDILVEIEEERNDSLASLIRLETIRPSVKLSERLRSRKAANKFMREEMVGSV